jgi:NADH dehydrogenase FAD-containing subunit
MTTSRKTIVLVGAGPANLHVIRQARRIAAGQGQLILVSPDPYWFNPKMAPDIMNSYYGLNDFRLDLAAFSRQGGVEFIQDEVTSLLPKQKKILTAAGRMLTYDAAAFAIGALSAEKESDIPVEGSFPVRPIRNVLEIRNEVETMLELFPDKCLEIVVLGGGPSGVEFALNTAAFLQERKPRRRIADPGWTLTLLEKKNRLLPGLPEKAGRRAGQALALADVTVRTAAEVQHVHSRRLVLDYGETLDYDIAVVAMGRRVPELFYRADLTTDENGAVFVERTLAVSEAPDLFATGECCRFWNEPTETSDAGPLLARNLEAWLAGRPLESAEPRKRWQWISLGPDEAMVFKDSRLFHGRGVLRLKRWLEQRAMKQFQSQGKNKMPGERQAPRLLSRGQ